MVEVEVGGCTQLAVVDTGAQITVLSEAMVERIGIPPEVLAGLPTAKLRGFGRDGIVEGKRGICVKFRVGSREIKWPVFIAPARDDVLLGLDFLMAVDATVKARGGLWVDAS